MELKFIEHKEALKENAKYERDIYEIGNYRVIRDLSIYESGRVHESFDVSANREKEYLPDIYFDSNIFDNNCKKEFKIQTTAYGALSTTKILQVVNGYDEALEIVNILTNKFLKQEG